MADQPFISQQDRPNLDINMEGKVGDLTVRELASILGFDPSAAPKLKETPASAIEKPPAKEIQKEFKDRKDTKDHKDQKEPKDTKDHKDSKDHKDPKEPKDHKDAKEHKDHKDPKDRKDHKDHKDQKDHKDTADHKAEKDHKDHKDQKDHKETKEGLKEIKEIKEIKEGPKELSETPVKSTEESGPSPVQGGTELDSLIRRVSGLEQSMSELKKEGRQ